jgi:hypothetical protein
VLSLDTTLSGHDITFAQTVNSDGTARVLTVNSNNTGTTTFGGAVGGTSALAALTTNADGTTRINGGSVATAVTGGNQTFNDWVVLGADTTFSGRNIAFNSTLDSDSAATPRSVVVNSNNSGTTTFGGAVGASAILASVTTNADGTTVISGGVINTVAATGDQTFNDVAVVLGADTTLSGNDITFVGTIESASTARALTVNSGNNGTTTFGGSVGTAGPLLASITTNADGTTRINGGSMRTVTADGDQIFNDAVVLGANTTFSGNDITFAGTLNSDSAGTPRLATVNSNNSGVTTFGLAVGGTFALQALTTNADGTTHINGGSVTTVAVGGDQTFNDPVVLGADTTFSGHSITFVTTLDSDSAATPRSVLVNSNNNGTTTFGAAAGGNALLASVTTNADGTTRIAGSVTTVAASGDQTYNDVVALGADVTLSGNDITFASTIESDTTARALTVNSNNSGITTFTGSVGTPGLALASLTTNADGETRINGGAVRTTGDQAYDDVVVLGANTILTGNDIAFATTVNSDSAVTPRTLTVNSSGGGVTTFGGAVGGTFALQTLTTNADGTTRVNGGSVTTVFDQAFNDAVVLGADTTFSGHSINFAGTLNSDTAGTPRALVVNSSGGGTTTFGGAVGASAELASVTTNADGATVISGGAINTVAATGDQIFNDAVVLGAADATLSGNDITFNGTIESGGTARALTVNSNNNGVTTFQGTVGLPELASLTTNADGTTIINGGLVRTSGAQTYGDAVTLGANTQLTTTAAGGNGNISATTITGAGAGGQNLTFMAGTGDITVSGDVGGTRLGVLTVTSGDVVQFQGTGTQQAASLTVTTSTSTTFTGKVDLTSGVALAGTAGNVSFLDGLNTGAASSFANIGTLQIGDNLGDMSSIHTSLVHTAGPTVLAGTIASPTMTFGVTTLLDDTVLNATNNVNFNNALSGQHSLTISTAGATTFSDVVGGGGNALTTLSVTSGAGIAINGGAITTSGAQAYNNDATFDSATTLTSSADGITFGGSLTGPVAFADLTVGAGAGDFSVTGALTRVSNLSVTSAANVTFTGAVSAASNVDVTNTGDLTFTGALNAANLDITTAGNVSAVNVANAISGTTTFTVGGNVGYKEAGSILLGAATIGGLATIEARNGGITTTGLFQADDGMTLAAHDTSGGNNGTISVGAGGLQSSNAPIRLHAADDITVNGPINSNGGNIQFVSGDANGINYASPLLAPFLVGRESAQDEFGALTINAVVNAGTGQIMVVAAGDAGTGPSFADVNQGPAGALRSSLLSVVTLKGPGGLGNPGANITLDNLPPDTMNTNSTVRLFTCAWLGCPDPLPAPPLPPVKTLSPSLISYSGGNIRYTDSSGVNLAGLGTVADFYLFTSGSFTLTPNPFSAGSVFVEASDDIVIDLGQPLLKISNDPNASLNFIAGRDIWYVNPSYSGKGYTIGTPGTPFANHLNFTAVRSIVLNNSLYQDAAHNLTIAANAEIHTPFQDKLPSGAGHVTLLGSYQVQTGGNATISGIDFSLLGYGNVRPGSLPTDAPVLNDSFSDAADGWQAIARPLLEPAQVPNPYGQELIAGGTITLANTGVITVRGGTTTGSAANPMGNGARLQGGTVNIGQAGGANNPTQLVIQGGTNIVGYATSDSSDPNLLRRQANAMVVANGDMNVYLRSAPLDAVTDGVPFDGSYSMIIRGGTATASNSGATPLVVSALGVLQASQLTMETDGTILFQGGTATLRTANAAAASSALLLVSDNKTITTSGSMVLIGGIANVNTTDAVSGQPLTSTEAANAQAMARLDPSNLTLEVDGILVMQGGKTTGPAGSFASARIDAGNEIKITVNGSAPYEYISSAGVPTAVGPASFYMIGGSDSGFFDKNNVDLAGSLSYPQAFPITVTLAGSFLRIPDTGLAGSVVQTGAATFDDSLLSYTIFAQNDETRTIRIRRGFGDSDDLGVAACR